MKKTQLLLVVSLFFVFFASAQQDGKDIRELQAEKENAIALEDQEIQKKYNYEVVENDPLLSLIHI